MTVSPMASPTTRPVLAVGHLRGELLHFGQLLEELRSSTLFSLHVRRAAVRGKCSRERRGELHSHRTCCCTASNRMPLTGHAPGGISAMLLKLVTPPGLRNSPALPPEAPCLPRTAMRQAAGTNTPHEQILSWMSAQCRH